MPINRPSWFVTRVLLKLPSRSVSATVPRYVSGRIVDGPGCITSSTGVRVAIKGPSTCTSKDDVSVVVHDEYVLARRPNPFGRVVKPFTQVAGDVVAPHRVPYGWPPRAPASLGSVAASQSDLPAS